MSTIKPIETVYKGYRFRSRLEARWAIFFDATETKWSYEMEGYNIEGMLYLPDFYLPDYRLWVEIKPDDELEIENGIKKASKLCFQSKKVVVIFAGTPGEHRTILIKPWQNLPGVYVSKGEYDFFECKHCGKLSFIHMYKALREKGVLGDELHIKGCNCIERGKTGNSDFAVAKAKQARFEHGESG